MRVKAYINMAVTKSVLIRANENISALSLPQNAREIIDNEHYAKEFEFGTNHLYLKEGPEPEAELKTRGYVLNEIEGRHQKNLMAVLENCTEAGKKA